MEFDGAVDDDFDDKKLFETIAEKYREQGYKLPKLIFWNLGSRSEAMPMKENDNGVIIVSGFSSSLAGTIISGETDPYKHLINILNSDRYEIVGNAMGGNIIE